MKVLVLTPGVFDKGGIARYGRFQIRALREEFGDGEIAVASLMGRDVNDLEEPFEVAWCGPMPVGRASRPLLVWESLRLARRGRPALVLTQHLYMAPLARWLARVAGGRYAVNIYGLEVWSPLSSARARALRRSDLVISDCHHTADAARAKGLVARPPTVVWDCVDVRRYVPGEADPAVLSRYGIPRRDRFRILFLGRIAPDARYKGTERLLRLASRLGEGFEVVYAGRGGDVEYLKRLAAETGVADRALFAGAIDEADMPDVYRSADAFFLVSEAGDGLGEGIPLTPLEAMACGVPVLVGDQDGSRETLDGPGGLCSGPGEIEAQAAYLRRLAERPELLREERAAARRRAESAFGFAAFSAKTRAAVRDVVERAR